MRHSLKELKILRGLFGDKIFSLFAEYADGNRDKFAEFLYEFYNRENFSDTKLNFMAYVENLIIADDNIVARILANGKEPDLVLINALILDIDTIFDVVENADALGWYSCGHERFNDSCEAYGFMKATYPVYGYGKFMQSYAFSYENGNLIPIATSSDKFEPSLNRLKDYASEKRLIENNLISFIRGLPCFDMLLYGDRGTGKSSTVHAMAFKHFMDGVRLIELDRSRLTEISTVRKLVNGIPLKFIILIDDLTINDCDEGLSSLKTCLEGTSEISENTMIVATSNRRHIVKENFSDRENAVHSTEVLQEQLSLSDRFGLTVMFSSTGKDEYLSIVKQLASDANLKMSVNELCALAERWAISKGGRSPRRARQFCDLAVAAQAKGEPIDF